MLKALKSKQNGITLIALIITIIVLLILAGVTIAAISSNESAPNKAVEARQKNEQGAEFDAIKVAAVSSVAAGNLDLYVDIPTLKAGLQGLVTDDLDTVLNPSLSEWTVTGNTGTKYLITNRGNVTKINGLSLSSSLTIKEGETVSLTVTKQGSAEGKQVSWGKNGNVTFVTSLTDATEVATPTTDTVYVKAGALSTGGTATVTVSATGEDSQTCNITIGGVASSQSTVTTNPTATGGTGTQADPYVMAVKETKTGTITIAVKDANGNSTTADSITYTSTTPAVAKLTLGATVDANTVTDENKSTSIVTVKGIKEDSTGSVITIQIDNVTKYVKVVVTENSIDYGRAINTSTYGQTVNYSTTIRVGENDVTLSNWKKFYENDRGETYIILADYMPNSAIDTNQFTGINKSGSYAVYASNNRKQLIDAMNSSYWDALKTGKLNAGTANEKNVTATSAVGSPTLDLWQVSWNTRYPNTETYTTNQLYKSKRTGMSDTIGWGYYVSRNSSVGTSTYAEMSGSEGYINSSNGNYNTLYFPHSSSWNSTYGYWLASPSAYYASEVMYVSYDGNVANYGYDRASRAFRPVVCLPSSVFE
ncbi:MAG: hypothetical protein IJH76_03795 [Clostridia bacterium]|nr:hypothetical protein [Clostridia bacterium]